MKDDEKYFMARCLNEISNHGTDNYVFIYPRDLISDANFPIHCKRAWFLLEKWCGRCWYEYGTTIDLGWITEKGNVEMRLALGDYKLPGVVEDVHV